MVFFDTNSRSAGRTMPPQATIQDPLKTVLEALDNKVVSIPKLSKLSGVDRARIYRIRLGRKRPSYETVMRLYTGLQKHLEAVTNG